MLAVLFLFLFWGLPVLVCAYLCEQRNRSVSKGVFLGFFFGWFAAIGLWLGLKTRAVDNPRLLF